MSLIACEKSVYEEPNYNPEILIKSGAIEYSEGINKYIAESELNIIIETKANKYANNYLANVYCLAIAMNKATGSSDDNDTLVNKNESISYPNLLFIQDTISAIMPADKDSLHIIYRISDNELRADSVKFIFN